MIHNQFCFFIKLFVRIKIKIKNIFLVIPYGGITDLYIIQTLLKHSSCFQLFFKRRITQKGGLDRTITRKGNIF